MRPFELTHASSSGAYERRCALTRSANVVRVVRFAIRAGRAHRDLPIFTADVKAIAPSVIASRTATQQLLFFQAAQRRAAIRVLRAKRFGRGLDLRSISER